MKKREYVFAGYTRKKYKVCSLRLYGYSMGKHVRARKRLRVENSKFILKREIQGLDYHHRRVVISSTSCVSPLLLEIRRSVS